MMMKIWTASSPERLMERRNAVKQEICVGDQEGGLRIDKYLAEAAGQLSRSYIQKLLKDGRILVNGEAGKSKLCGEDEGYSFHGYSRSGGTRNRAGAYGTGHSI